MTNNLDNMETIKKLDQANILKTFQDLPLQIEKCWADWQKIAIPTHYATCKNVLILGMGGSGIGASIVASLAKYHCPLIVEVSRDYNIPAWVDKNTLVIAASYSGDTEETIEAFREAASKTEKLITVSSGGKLTSLGSQHRALHYQIEYTSQPRAAIGYNLTSLLAIFSKLRLMEIKNEDITETVELLKGLIDKIDVDVQNYRNPAKLLAQKLSGKIPVVLASGQLSEVARRWKSDFNENAKNQSYFEEIPEMNHNSLVGLEFPDELSKKMFFILLESKYSYERNKLRQIVVTQILTQRKISYETIMIEPSGGKVAEIFQMIAFGEFAAFYLAILNNIDPEPVKIIDYLKEKLNEKN